MSYPQPTIHPLERTGTMQRERLLKALIPDNLLLDDRSLADLVAFAGSFSGQVRYWNEYNQPDGSWTPFWEHDATALLALVSATDLDQIQVKFRNAELAFVRACKAEKRKEGVPQCEKALTKLHKLVAQIRDVAALIEEIAGKLPGNHPLKTEAAALIRDKLGVADKNGTRLYDGPLATLVSYHKGIGEHTGLIELYQPFFDDEALWGLTVHDFLNCIDYRQITHQDQEALWRLFLEFFKVLTFIVGRAGKAFHQSLHGRSDHPPHIALFLAFALLFRRYHQAALNGLAARHLNYYYLDILRLQQRREIPDKVHLVFQLVQQADSYKIEKDTLFTGGQDVNGNDLLYKLADELVISQAALVEKQNLGFYKDESGSIISVAMRGADKRDGLQEAYPPKIKSWAPLTGESLYKKYEKKGHLIKNLLGESTSRSPELEEVREKIGRIMGHPGFFIASPELWLAQGGKRTIRINGITSKITELFDVFLSTSEQMVDIGRYAAIRGEDVTFTLPEQLPDIMPVQNDPWVPADLPCLQFTLRSFVSRTDAAELRFDRITLQTANTLLKNVSIQVGSTPYAPSSDIPMAGSPSADTRYTLYVIAPELTFKKVKKPVLVLPSLREDHGMIAVDPVEEKEIYHPGKPEYIHFADMRLSEPVPYTVATPYSYFKKEYTLAASGEGPLKMVSLPAESIAVSYQSEPVEVTFGDSNALHRFYHIDDLGGYADAREETFIPAQNIPGPDEPLRADPATVTLPADGNLRLGFEDLLPGQTLSLLFHFADGSGNPDHIAPEEVVWSYLRNDEWVRVPPRFILLDETLRLCKTGIVRFQVPSDINNGNTLAMGEGGRKDLYWLQASARNNPRRNIYVSAMPHLVDIFPQAATAVFENHRNDLGHLPAGLPAGSITEPRFRDAGISQVIQPFASFDGRLGESADVTSYYRRIQERLRHRNRAVTIWDYERLLLEKFPKVALAKCLPHTRDTAVEAAGYVTLAVVPYPGAMTGDGCYYPVFNAGELEEMEDFLNRFNSFFVSGKGGGTSCCCGCEEDKSRLLVRNAMFEPVRLQVCVKFRKGREALFYKKQLNNDLKDFLAPWATDTQAPLVFGTRIYSVELLRFLENLDYVDAVLGMKVKHFPDRDSAGLYEQLVPFEEAERIEPFTSRSLLTTYLDILNEDNANVLDHEILLAGEPGCMDCGC
ncbi:hypothetical protein [Dyadobacter sandarakinus]|uniref:Baseplate J-like protein n=1 Tax=Dyadobacter sandarakinus TaxID=2747268 RepID=A0ABX7I4Z5_9BACT|nr:hypothetical protein [Dyadobacter sandarakinus]QRR00607.1 hypothetical protein HWI92_06645 [Dyadobacter sandarakinus]